MLAKTYITEDGCGSVDNTTWPHAQRSVASQSSPLFRAKRQLPAEANTSHVAATDLAV
jgi:hypothetical protein